MLPSIFNSKRAATTLAFGFATFFVAACSHAPSRPVDSAPLDRQLSTEDPYPVKSVTIRIEQLARDQWQATYQTDVAVEKLFFELSLDRTAHGNWFSIDPEFALDTQGTKQFIHRKDGRPFQASSFRFGTYPEFLQTGYSYSIPFKDGSSALYSPYFLVHGSQPPKTRFILMPANGQSVVIDGKASQETVHWTSPVGPNEYGAYLYFGDIKPVDRGSYEGLIDPKLPKWIKEYTSKVLPWVLAQQEQRLGSLHFGKPYIIINRWPRARELHKFSGGAADHWLQLGLAGKDWDQDTAEGHEKLFYFIAHEVSHFWTSQKRADFERLGWINEGGANFFANELALEYHLISKQEHDHRVELAAQSCKDVLAAHPEAVISQTGSKIDGRVGYECGHVIHFALNQLLHKENPKFNLFSFWNELLKRAEKENGGLFSETEYFALARTWIQSPALTKDLHTLESFVTGPNHSEPFPLQSALSIKSSEE